MTTWVTDLQSESIDISVLRACEFDHYHGARAGVLGAYAYLGPKAGREIFNLASEQADVTFGAVTVLTGVFGTIVGGRSLTGVHVAYARV